MTGKHIDVTDAMRSHAEDRVLKLPRYYSGINQVEVIVDGGAGGQFSVEVIARGEHSNVFVASDTGDDTYACIDMAVHKLERQLSKKKEKERSHKHSNDKLNGSDEIL